MPPSPSEAELEYGTDTHVMNYSFGLFFHHVSLFPSVLEIPTMYNSTKPLTDERGFALGNLIVKSTMMNNEFRLFAKVKKASDDIGHLHFIQNIMECPIEYFNRLEINYPSLIELRKCCDDISNNNSNNYLDTQCFNINQFLLERRLSWLNSVANQENRVLEWSNTLSDDFGNNYQQNGLKMLYSPTCAIVFSDKSNISECETEMRGLIFKFLKETSFYRPKLIVLFINGIVYLFSIYSSFERDVNLSIYNVLNIHNNITDLTRLFQITRYFLAANLVCLQFSKYTSKCFFNYNRMYKTDTCPWYRELMEKVEKENERKKNGINKQHKTTRNNSTKNNRSNTLVLEDITNKLQNMKL